MHSIEAHLLKITRHCMHAYAVCAKTDVLLYKVIEKQTNKLQ